MPDDNKRPVRRVPSGRESILRPPDIGDEKGVRIAMTGGRCYRIPIREVGARYDADEEMTHEGGDLDIKLDDITGQYVLHLGNIVRPECYRFIVGSKGATLQQLEKDTGASITIPKTVKEQKIGIIIRGLNEQAVVSAKTRIDFIIESNKHKVPYTHFISIPLDMSSLLESTTSLVSGLKDDFVSESSRVHSSIFQRPEKLHLTVVMLRLYGDDDIKKATETLKKCSKFVEENFSGSTSDFDCRIHIKGMQIMNDDPSRVNVLYLGIERDVFSEKLLQLIDYCSQQFVLVGLCTSKETENNRKLHATLMNTKWRKDFTEPDPVDDDDELLARRPDARLTFDATEILNKYENIDLGHHKLMRLEVSTMQEKGETGYFDAVHSINFP